MEKSFKLLFPILVLCVIFAVYFNINADLLTKDKKIIKDFRSHHNYSFKELEELDIKFLGEVNRYRIYFVPYKGSNDIINDIDWEKDGYSFPIYTHTRIIGIKDHTLYTLGMLLNETSINTKNLYDVLPEEYKHSWLYIALCVSYFLNNKKGLTTFWIA